MTKIKRDIYQDITNKIIAVLERVDMADFEAPFASLAAQGLPQNPVTEHRYQGINIPSLWVDQQEKGFASNHWATFKQWKARGASVRKGEKGSQIIFYKTLIQEEEAETGENKEQYIPMLKSYTVFNADQVEGYEHSENVGSDDIDHVTRLQAVEAFCAFTGADIRHGGESAYYRRDADFIQMPETKAFQDTTYSTATQNYYSVLLHELTHWTGAKHRLDRDQATSKSNREKYAFEELIAELGATFLCSALGVTQTPRDDHAIYLKGWLSALRGDKKYIFKASAQAGKACEFLYDFQKQNMGEVV